MKPGDIIRLLKRHILLLILIPLILGTAVAFLTKDIFSSKTTLYTGLTSGTNVQVDQSFNLFTTNASFDNLINIIQSRETSQEVSIRLLAQHLMLNASDPRYISRESFTELQKMTPMSIRKLIIKHVRHEEPVLRDSISPADTSVKATTFSFNDPGSDNSLNLMPASIDRQAYEQTVRNLQAVLSRDDTNYIYRLMNGGNPHYSIKAISSVNVQRINSSDLIELKYISDDPGICQQTLTLLTEVCMKNYRKTKETRSDAVVKYFEFKTRQSFDRLTSAENRLMNFNQQNNIINFDAQSQAAAGAKASLYGELQNKRIKLAGQEATVQELEEKLNNQQKVQLNSSNIIEKRNQLADINSKIATAESTSSNDAKADEYLAGLKSQAEKLNSEISDAVSDLYNSSSAVQGMTGGTLLNTYLTNVKDLQETKATITMLESRIGAAQKEYSNYEPAGVNIKRIEREITISEQEYLEQLRSLNVAKLKLQDIELSSNIKAVDPPYYPLKPDSSKRLMLIVAAAVFGFLLVLFAILGLEYFDATLKNPRKAAKILNLHSAGVYPKINGKDRQAALPLVTNRLIEMIIQQIELHPQGRHFHKRPRTILFFSTLDKEGKTVILGNIAQKMKQQGKKVISINFSGESLLQSELTRLDEDMNKHPKKEKALLGQNNDSLPMILNEHNQIEEGPLNELSLEVPETERSAAGQLIYQVDESYYSVNSYLDLLQRNPFNNDIVPDYVLIELPPLLYHSYPSGLVASSDLAVMICRSNRAWSEADKGALDTFMKLTPHQPLFVLNGVESQVVKATVGELPKKPKGIRKKMKKMAKA